MTGDGAGSSSLGADKGLDDGVVGGVRQVWRDVLDVGPDAESESFFELGGDSLVAMELSTRLEELTAVYIEPAKIFELEYLPRLLDAIARGLKQGDTEEGQR